MVGINSKNLIITKPNLKILVIKIFFLKKGQNTISEIREHILKALHFYYILNSDIKRLTNKPYGNHYFTRRDTFSCDF